MQEEKTVEWKFDELQGMYDHLLSQYSDLMKENKLLKAENERLKAEVKETGLKDKNGKMICEGHIVRIQKMNYEVFWDKHNCGWGLIDAKRDGDKYGVYRRNISLNEEKEIIGSVTENPELSASPSPIQSQGENLVK